MPALTDAPDATDGHPGPPGHHRLAPAAQGMRSSAIRDLLRLTARPEIRSMAGGIPAPDLLPTDRLALACAEVFARDGVRAVQYGPTEGFDELRAQVAGDLHAAASDVLITTGSQQALDLVVRTLVGPGELVVAEAPSYLGALQAVQASGGRVVQVRGDHQGIDVDELAGRLAAGAQPKLCSVVPNFANPSGATLSEHRRCRLVELARLHGFVIVEDDPYGELRFRGVAPPSLRALGPDVVVGVRSLSKIVAPGLRVGWLAAPHWLVAPLTRTKQTADLHTAGLNQLVANEVLRDTEFLATHLDRLRAHYARRQAALLGALEQTFGDAVRSHSPDGGMFVWVHAADTSLPASERWLAAALDHGTAFVPGTAFSTADADTDTDTDTDTDAAEVAVGDGARGDRHLRLCCSTLSPADLTSAVADLAAAAVELGWRS